MHRIRKGDNVKVISGRDKGKSGKVLRVFPREKRAMVEGINVRAKRAKPRKAGQKGQIIHVAMPIQESNLMPVCPSCQKPARVQYKLCGDKSKLRVCKKCGEEIGDAGR